MSNEEKTDYMIKFIQEKEKELQAVKLANSTQARTDIVKVILNELERIVKNED